MKKRTMKVIALLLAAMMGCTACGQTDVSSDESSNGSETQKESTSEVKESETAESTDEIVTLSLYSQFNNGGSDVAVWYQNWLGENLGINLQSTTGTGEMMQALLASGDLPDIVAFSSNEDLDNAIEGGLILNLDEYKDQLPNVFGDELFEPGIKYNRENKSAGTGGLYVLPLDVGAYEESSRDPEIRWDLYKKLGYPEITTWDEFLDVLKQMQELEPETEDGLPMYAYTLWSNWDGRYMRCVYENYSVLMGYTHEPSQLTEMKEDGSEEPKSILDDDSIYKQGLEYLFKANQMGLVDPDSVTQTWDVANGKMLNGQTSFVFTNWYDSYNKNVDSEDFKGYASFAPELYTLTQWYGQVTGHATRCLAISATCENVDKALEFVNWYYSIEADELLQNGPEGLLWEEQDGIKVPTQTYYETEDRSTLQVPGGGTIPDAYAIINASARTPYERNPETGQRTNIWAEIEAEQDNELVRDWEAQNGDYLSMADKQRQTGVIRYKSAITAFYPTAPDDIAKLEDQIGEVVKTNSWKMVFAEDKEEFDALWEQMKEDAEAIGIDKVVEDAKERYAIAKETMAKYTE